MVLVPFHVTVLAGFRHDRRGNAPAITQSGGAVGRNSCAGGVFVQVTVGANIFDFCAQALTVQHGYLEAAIGKPEETVAVIGQHGLHTGVSGLHNAPYDTLIVIRSRHTIDQPLHVAEIIIGGKDQVVGVGGAVRSVGVGRKVQEAASV